MSVLRDGWFWALAFVVLFALSIDFWAWDWTTPSVFGLPYTIVYVIVLETALFVLYYLFIRFYWSDKQEAP